MIILQRKFKNYNKNIITEFYFGIMNNYVLCLLINYKLVPTVHVVTEFLLITELVKFLVNL